VIKVKKQIQDAITRILQRDTDVMLDGMLAGLELETGMTRAFILRIVKNMEIVHRLQIRDGIVSKPEPSERVPG